MRNFFSITLRGSLLIAIAFSTVFISKPYSAQASTSFDPGSLITNTLFTARDSMSADDIQAFLTEKGSVLASIPSSYLGEAANGRSAAQIIYDATRASVTGFGGSNRPSNPFTVSLNPQVVLATLQKETSLITGSYTIGSGSLTSVLRMAMGYGCPDGGGCDEAYAGFTNQVSYGSAQLWLDYWRANNGTAVSYAVGSQQSNASNPVYSPYCPSGGTINFTVANAATSSLYRYTPHVCNGNANFWYFISYWFPSRLNAFLNEARVIYVDGDVTNYAYWPRKNLRWPIKDINSRAAWGLDAKVVEMVTGEALNAIPAGSGQLSLLSRAISSPEVFFMERARKRYVSTWDSLVDRNLSDSDLSRVDDDLIAEYLEAAPVGGFAKEAYNPDIYLTSWAWKYYMDDFYTINNYGFSSDSVRVLEPGSLEPWTAVPNIEWVVRQYDHPDVYIVSNGQKLYVPSADMLRHWGLLGEPTRLLGPDIMNRLSRGKTMTRVAKGSGPDVYVVENGKRRYVRSWARLRAKGFKSSDLIEVSDPILYRLPLGSPL